MDQDARRARPRTVLLFAVTGFVFGTWAARIPDVQQRLALSPASLAVVFGVLEAGAVVGLPLGGVLVARAGSRWCLRAGAVLFPLGLVGIALAPSLAVLAAVVAGWAAVNSVVDVALNAQGLEVERRLRRPALSGLHAGHGGGLLAGAAASVAAVGLGLGLLGHAVLTAAGSLAVGLAASRRLLDEPRVTGPRRRLEVPDARLLLLGAVAFCVFALDGTANSWSAVHLRELGASPVLAAVGYAGFAGAVVAGRLVGDRLRARLGPRRLVTAAGAVATVAATVVVTAPDPALAAVGWTLLGLAVAPLAPTVLAAAAVGAAAPAGAVATTTAVGYLGSFAAPPVVGLVAARSSVATGLLALVPAALGVALLARPALRPRRAARSASSAPRSGDSRGVTP